MSEARVVKLTEPEVPELRSEPSRFMRGLSKLGPRPFDRAGSSFRSGRSQQTLFGSNTMRARVRLDQHPTLVTVPLSEDMTVAELKDLAIKRLGAAGNVWCLGREPDEFQLVDSKGGVLFGEDEAAGVIRNDECLRLIFEEPAGKPTIRRTGLLRTAARASQAAPSPRRGSCVGAPSPGRASCIGMPSVGRGSCVVMGSGSRSSCTGGVPPRTFVDEHTGSRQQQQKAPRRTFRERWGWGKQRVAPANRLSVELRNSRCNNSRGAGSRGEGGGECAGEGAPAAAGGTSGADEADNEEGAAEAPPPEVYFPKLAIFRRSVWHRPMDLMWPLVFSVRCALTLRPRPRPPPRPPPPTSRAVSPSPPPPPLTFAIRAGGVD